MAMYVSDNLAVASRVVSQSGMTRFRESSVGVGGGEKTQRAIKIGGRGDDLKEKNIDDHVLRAPPQTPRVLSYDSRNFFDAKCDISGIPMPSYSLLSCNFETYWYAL
jgi:hypothetical protein